MENDDVKKCGLVSDGYTIRGADWKQPGCNILPYPRLENLAASAHNDPTHLPLPPPASPEPHLAISLVKLNV